MIGLDTNVLVRYLVQDDPVQSPQAGQLMERHCTADDPCLVNAIVLSESAENPAVQGLSLPTFTSVFVAIHPSKHPVFELHKPLPERFPTGVAVPRVRARNPPMRATNCSNGNVSSWIFSFAGQVYSLPETEV